MSVRMRRQSLSRAGVLFALAAVCVIASVGRDGRVARAAIVPGTISTIAGGGVGDGGPATAASIAYPVGLATRGPDTYIIDQNNCRVRKVTGGTISTVAGRGCTGTSDGDGGPATAAALYAPWGVAVDGTGNLYISDFLECVVRKVSSGIITLFAGMTGTCSYSGDTGPATSATLNSPFGLTTDGAGSVYIADAQNCRIREVTSGNITTVAGNGTCSFGGDNGPATAANLLRPKGLTFDSLGNLYIADALNCRIRKVNGGTITTAAGNGTCAYGGDNGLATSASLNRPSGVAVDGSNNLVISDETNCRLRKVVGTTISTIAGNGTCSYGGDGGAATSASVNLPSGLAFDGSGNLYIADDQNCRVREVAAGTITTSAGTGFCLYAGDGGPATNAELNSPYDLALDLSGNVFIEDSGNCRVREVSGGTIATVAGNGVCGYGGDGLAPSAASISGNAQGIAFDGAGHMYISDSGNCRIREIAGGVITTIAGNGTCGFGGDTTSATSAMLDFPTGIAFDASGKLYIADFNNCRIRRVSAGIITTVAGTGTCDFAGDNGPATNADLSSPTAVAFDVDGAMYIADSANCRIRKVASGTITTVAGTGTCGYGGDGATATAALLDSPEGVAVDAGGNIYISDYNNCRVREVHAGIISTIAGGNVCGDTGDGGPATSATLSSPAGLRVDAQRTVYVADSGNSVVRKITGQDTDGDGCPDAKELGANTLQGGNRSPDNPWDFFDTPEPVVRPADTTGTLSHAVTLGDVIGVLFYVGTTAASPNQANASGAKYGTDLNANGVLDGQEYDRTIPDQAHPWRSGPPDGAVSIGDAIVGLQQVGANCN